MAIIRFLYPIVDSGYFFDFELLEVIKERTPDSFALKFRYRLTNKNSIRMQIPIHISHAAYLNCRAEADFKEDKTPAIRSDRVLDLQSNKTMYGYGDDHFVTFEPNEHKEFLVLFEPSAVDFDTFDTEFFMKPDGEEYGLYRLRYEFKSGSVIQRYCLATYQERTPKRMLLAKPTASKFDRCLRYAMLVFLYLIFSPAMFYLGISSIKDEQDLQDKGVIASAAVIDSRILATRNGASYDVKYQFSVDGGKTWYSCSDRTGRKNIWCPVTEEQWQATRSTGQVEVIYLPGKPWINRPVHSTAGMIDLWAGVCLGLCPWLLLLIPWIKKKKPGGR